MDKTIKRKLKVILTVFIILTIPISYIIFSSALLDDVYSTYQDAVFSGDSETTEIALDKIQKAKTIVIFDKNLTSIQTQLLYKQKKYRQALNKLEKTNSYAYKALLYEHLNKPDSAAIYYIKTIPVLIKRLAHTQDTYRKYDIERQLAMFYTFLGQTDKANKFLKELPIDIDNYKKKIIHYYDYYIESYMSGGYKDYIEGETIYFLSDSLADDINIDSLMTANRFYSNSSTGRGNQCELEIRKIFEQKAINAGLIKKK